MSGLLRFANDENCEDLVHEALWTGDWPPPEFLHLVVGQTTQRMVVAETSGLVRWKEANPDWMDHAVIQMFQRVRASTLSDDDLAKTEHVMRGAVYTPVFMNQEEVDLGA